MADANSITVRVTRFRDRKNLVLWYRDPLSEKLVTRSARTANRRQAERAAADWERDLRSGTERDSRMAWEAFRRLFEEQYLAGKSDHTSDLTATAFNKLEAILRPARLSSITTQALQALRLELLRTVKPTTANSYLRHLRVALNWAVRQGLLAKAPRFSMCEVAKRSTLMRGRSIAGEEFERLLAAVPLVRKHDPDRWRFFLRGLWLSGLRLSEALQLSWDSAEAICIDFSGRYPRLRFFGEAQKNRRDQLTPIAPDFAELLLTIPEADRQGQVFPLGSRPDRQLSLARASRTISDIGRRANVVTNKEAGHFASAHDLRRAFGTRWASRVKPPVLKQLMRHANIQTSMDYYVALDADDTAAALWAAADSTFHSTLAAGKGCASGEAQKKTPIFSGAKAEGTGLEPATGRAGN